ncbi:MAG: 50S ribosomal protein L22 [Candidatus Aerophobetes bacterium]|nr:50S ribosomal protein L22 [Candidatus Aerophobetes bacterium]
MEVKAVGKYIRVSPLKLKKVADLVRGKSTSEAMNILNLAQPQNAREVAKVLKSALANAQNNFGLDPGTLYVKNAVVDKGPVFKRIRPRARGRADLIKKRTAHITVILSDGNL